MRILGRTDDNCLNPYDFCFLNMMPLPFDLPLGVQSWPRFASMSTAARLDGTVTTPARLDGSSVSTAARLSGTVGTE